MKLFRHFTDLPDDARGAVVALGNFDGLHLGHRSGVGAEMRADLRQRRGDHAGVELERQHTQQERGDEDGGLGAAAGGLRVGGLRFGGLRFGGAVLGVGGRRVGG